MKYLSIFTITIFLFSCHTTNAQTQKIQFDYDNAGNRIERYVVTLPPNGARLQNLEEFTLNTSILELNISIFPNPTKGNLVIALDRLPDSNAPSEVFIYDLSGRELLHYNELQQTNHLDLSSFAPGQYLMILFAENEKKEFKIIKQ